MIATTPPPAAPTLSMQAVTQRTGLSADTLRYYERLGVLPRVQRTDSGHRRFTEADIGWLAMVDRLRTTGMPLLQIREYAELVRAGADTIGARRAMLEAHAETVEQRISELQGALAAIHTKLAYYEARDCAPMPALPKGRAARGMAPESLVKRRA